MEDKVVNRYSLLLLAATSFAGGDVFGQSHPSGRSSNPPVHVAKSPVIPARSSAVPRPARPTGRLVSHQTVMADQEFDVIGVDYENAQENMVLGD